jgi:hypothetical protein
MIIGRGVTQCVGNYHICLPNLERLKGWPTTKINMKDKRARHLKHNNQLIPVSNEVLVNVTENNAS